jgi:hypothetical protein
MQVNRLPATSPIEIDEHLGRIPSLSPARTARRQRTAGEDALRHKAMPLPPGIDGRDDQLVASWEAAETRDQSVWRTIRA